MKYKVEIIHDYDAQDPMEFHPVELVSFNTRHASFRHPDTLEDNEVAYLLSYSEHGLCQWDLHGNGMPPGIDHWDFVGVAGALVFKDVEVGWDDVTDPDKYAQSVVDEYTDWCNGNTWGYVISKQTSSCDNPDHEEWEEVESCWGFIGDDYIIDVVKDTVGIDLPPLYQWDNNDGHGEIGFVRIVEEEVVAT